MKKFLVLDSKTKKIATQFSQMGFDCEGNYSNPATPMGFPKEFLNNLVNDAVTTPNTGWPAWNLTYFDPTIVDVLFAKTSATEIASTMKYGSWEKEFMTFKVAEFAGSVRPYSDSSYDNTDSLNFNMETRDAYRFQSIIGYGELQIAQASASFVNYVSEERRQVANLFNRIHNNIWFNGIAGRRTYGILNDPNLNANLTPATVPTNITLWSAKTPAQIIADIGIMLAQLRTQAGNYIDEKSQLKLCMSPQILTTLQTKVTDLTLASVKLWINQNFPNMEIITAPQYATGSGQLVQLIYPKNGGTDNLNCGFSELYRAHRIDPRGTYTYEKISATNYGAVIKNPWAIVGMLGV